MSNGVFELFGYACLPGNGVLLASLWAVLYSVCFLFSLSWFSTLCSVVTPTTPCPSPGSLRGLDQQDLHCRVPRIRPSASRVVDTLGDGVGLGRLRLPAWLQGIADGELSGTNIGDEGTRRWSLPNPASMCHGEGGVVRSALTAYIMPASPHLLQLPPRHPFYVLILSCCGRLTRRWDFAHRHQHHTTSHKAHPP